MAELARLSVKSGRGGVAKPDCKLNESSAMNDWSVTKVWALHATVLCQ